MNLIIPIITLAFGFGIGWAVRRAQTLARFGREMIWLDKQSLDFQTFAAKDRQTSALLEAADADNDLDLLACLENGHVSEAKRFMIHKLGMFYQKWTGRPQVTPVPQSIEKSLSRIREAAENFPSVQAVLTYSVHR